MNSETINLDNIIRVWNFELDIDDAALSRLSRMLDENEHQRADSFHFEIHRRWFIASRGLMREILAECTGIKPELLCFNYNSYGKPRVVVNGPGNDIRFDMSNSDGMGAIAITDSIELGLDIEHIRTGKDHELVVSTEFANDEKDWFFNLHEDQRLRAFYHLWTCKEAYLNGKGMGLSIPLNKFAVSFEESLSPTLAWSEIDNADPDFWSLHVPDIGNEYVACLAVAGECKTIRNDHWLP